MGKSSKKIKSDRINALRKQYDAFLEDDKKRKERNDFILGRLDKMRYSTALLPLRHKPGIIPEHSSRHQETPSSRDYQLSCTKPTQIITDIPLINEERVPETFLIQEISKKYILIPKLRSPFTNNSITDVSPSFDTDHIVNSKFKKEVKISDVNNSDWKSKYEILNVLKKEEKEEAPVQSNTDTLHNYLEKPATNNVENINESAVNVDRDRDVGDKYLNEIPEKDLPDKLSYEQAIADTEYAPNLQYEDRYSVDASDKIDEQKENVPITPNVQNDPTTEIDYKMQLTHLEYNSARQALTNQPTEFTEYVQNVEMQPAYNINTAFEYPNEQNFQMQPEHGVNTVFDDPNQQTVLTANAIENVDTTYYDEAKTSNHTDLVSTEQVKDIRSPENDILDENKSQAQVLTPDDFLEEVNKSPPSVEHEAHVDNVEYPIDIINVQEFTPNDDAQLQDGVNINPDVHIIQQNDFELPNQDLPRLEADIEHQQEPFDTTGIEEFEAEQENFFYSEHADNNYTQQGGAGDVYNPEYAQNEAYRQNEYAYYEGTQPGAYPPVEINEHEETAQQYDQNYEQQYVGSYEQGYEQQQYQESGENYPSQHEVQQLHYQQQNEETLEHVQQDLDNEQGYSEIQNIVQANEQDKLSIMKSNEAEKAVPPQKQQGDVLLS